jgi:hypothetical protein
VTLLERQARGDKVPGRSGKAVPKIEESDASVEAAGMPETRHQAPHNLSGLV